MPSFLTVIFAVTLSYFLFKWGLGLIRAFGAPRPEPPPEGELRRVRFTYRCSNCGLEIRTTVSPSEDPDPPHHCMEEMEIIQSVDL